MYTLGFSFRPWRDAKAIADAPAIMNYLRDAVRDGKLDEKIRFGKKVVEAKWSTTDGKWFVTIEDGATGETGDTAVANSCISCAGYYNYDKAYWPDSPGLKTSKGRLCTRNSGPEDLDYNGKKVVVIGSRPPSTLVPAMAWNRRPCHHVATFADLYCVSSV